ncbi:MAG: hypothetical protein CVV06_13615, partial [Gammaproteobacteria bacterium HGW-Gammaproteobacteria-10]
RSAWERLSTAPAVRDARASRSSFPRRSVGTIGGVNNYKFAAIPSLKNFAAFRVRGMPVEERLSSELPNLLQNSWHKEVIFHEILS